MPTLALSFSLVFNYALLEARLAYRLNVGAINPNGYRPYFGQINGFFQPNLGESGVGE